jgi:heme/copper-type cytochrome/quinol oxidase subunit 2
MQMDIVVETQEEYNKWMAEQQTWMQKQATATPTTTIESPSNVDSLTVNKEVTAQVTMPSH